MLFSQSDNTRECLDVFISPRPEAIYASMLQGKEASVWMFLYFCEERQRDVASVLLVK